MNNHSSNWEEKWGMVHPSLRELWRMMWCKHEWDYYGEVSDSPWIDCKKCGKICGT